MWRLNRTELICFALGTVLNDLTAACWFTYLLIYLEDTLYFDPTVAGVVVLVGQISDAIATPLVGLGSDMSDGKILFNGAWHLDRRTLWHLVGTCLVIVFYTLIWTVECCSGQSNHGWNAVYYAIGAAIFNFGWASVQVSHLALTGDLSKDEDCRTRINSARHSFSIISSLLVFASYLVLIETVHPTGEKSADKFHYLAAIVLVVGIATSIVFYWIMNKITYKREFYSSSDFFLQSDDPTAYLALNELHLQISGTNSEISQDEDTKDYSKIRTEETIRESISASCIVGGDNESQTTASDPFLGVSQRDPTFEDELVQNWTDWLKEPKFYMVGAIYMLSRLAMNITMVYMSFYLVKTLEMDDAALALVPATMYLSSFLTTLRLEKMNKKLGRNKSFYFGALANIIASVLCAFFGTQDIPQDNYVYIAFVIFGFGTAVTIVGSLSIIADLVGENLKWGAFVYGVMSFADKLAAGVVIIGIQLHRDNVCINENDEPDTEECQDFVRIVMSTIPSASSGMAVLILAIMTKLYSTNS